MCTYYFSVASHILLLVIPIIYLPSLFFTLMHTLHRLFLFAYFVQKRMFQWWWWRRRSDWCCGQRMCSGWTDRFLSCAGFSLLWSSTGTRTYVIRSSSWWQNTSTTSSWWQNITTITMAMTMPEHDTVEMCTSLDKYLLTFAIHCITWVWKPC